MVRFNILTLNKRCLFSGSFHRNQMQDWLRCTCYVLRIKSGYFYPPKRSEVKNARMFFWRRITLLLFLFSSSRLALLSLAFPRNLLLLSTQKILNSFIIISNPDQIYIFAKLLSKEINNNISCMEEEAPMKALVLDGPLKLAVKLIPRPKPQEGEVLIKVMAAPINPSDLIFIQQGAYEHKKTPCVPGFEGSGVVIANGGGLIGWGLLDKRVAFTPTITSGTYAQYALAKAGQCMPIEDTLSFEHGSMSFVNPLTAMALLQKAKEKKAKTVIANAAASALGRMINRLFPPEGIEVINIVRKAEQVEVLRKEGANFILNSSDVEFEEKLKEMATNMKATVCLDAIGGKMTGKMLSCMPKHSIVYVYGALEGPNVDTVEVRDFIYNDATITGFFLPNWLEGKGILKMLPTIIKLRKYLRNELKSDIAHECSLEEFETSAKEYMKNMTKGKVILKPFQETILKEEKEDEKGKDKEEK